MRRIVGTAIAMVAVSAAMAVPALAGPQPMASGGGKTHDGASYGFNAKDDNRGSFNYVGVTEHRIRVNGTVIPVGSRFIGHCFAYTRTNFDIVRADPGGEARLFARCRGFFFVDGGPPIRTRVFLQAHVVDFGEPGRRDRAWIAWGLHPAPGQGDAGLFIWDGGTVQRGNIQVKFA
jgi:hypothetical protein